MKIQHIGMLAASLLLPLGLKTTDVKAYPGSRSGKKMIDNTIHPLIPLQVSYGQVDTRQDLTAPEDRPGYSHHNHQNYLGNLRRMLRSCDQQDTCQAIRRRRPLNN